MRLHGVRLLLFLLLLLLLRSTCAKSNASYFKFSIFLLVAELYRTGPFFFASRNVFRSLLSRELQG